MKLHAFKAFFTVPKNLLAALAALGVLFAAAPASRANTYVWTGSGAPNALWSNSANWGFAGTPGPGDSVIFQGVAGLNNTNDIAGLALSQVTFISSGFILNGNTFTVSNSITAMNFTGTALIYNSNNIAGTNLSFIVSNNITLRMGGGIAGPVGIIKSGAGTLLYQAIYDNTYTGATQVREGLLQLNMSGFNAFYGPLVIGDGVTFATVQELQGQEIPDTMPITINSGSILDLNNNVEYTGSILNMTNGTISVGSGVLDPGTNAVFNLGGNNYIDGSVTFAPTGSCTIQGSGSMTFGGALNGGANIVENGNLTTVLYGASTFTGTLTVNATNGSGNYLYLFNNKALGSTNGGTFINGACTLYLGFGINITNEPLTLNNSTGSGFYTGAGNTNVWVSTNFTILGAETVFVDTNASLELNGPITGPGSITKTGSGRLLYSGTTANTYPGLTTVSQGELDLGKASGQAIAPYGAGLMIGDGVDNAAVKYLNPAQIFSVVTPVTITNLGQLNLNNYNDTISPLTINSGLIFTGSGQLSVVNTVYIGAGYSYLYGNVQLSSTVLFTNYTPALSLLDITGTVSGLANYALVKSGPGTMALDGANTYGGLTLVQQGYFWIENNAALGSTNAGTIVSSGASLVLAGNIGVTNESLTLNGPNIPGLWGSLDVKIGTNTWCGPITNNGASTLDALYAGCALRINGPISGPGSLELFGVGTHFFEGIANNSIQGGVLVDQGTSLVLNKINTGAAITNSLEIAGSVHLARSLQMATNADVLIDATGILDMETANEDFNTLHGSGSVTMGQGAALIIGRANGTSTFDGSFSGFGNPSAWTIEKLGSGTFTLNGNHTFVDGYYNDLTGKLLINGSSLVPVSVAAPATFGGSGSVGSIFSSGTLTPGNPLGKLTARQMTFGSGGVMSVQLNGRNAGTDYDELIVTGTVSLANASLQLAVNFTNPVALGQQFMIITNDGVDAITGTFFGLAEGAAISTNGYTFGISYVGGSGNDVVLTLTNIPGAEVAGSVTAGNGNHTIEYDECNNLDLAITNKSGTAMTGVTATLSTTTENVLITQPYSAYPTIGSGGVGTNLTAFQISTLPHFPCGQDINLQLAVSSSAGDFVTSFALHTGGAATSSLRWDNNTNTSIPDIGTLDSTNPVTGFSGPLEKVAVSLWITHTLDSDLSLSLVSPDGTTVPLVSGVGAGANFGTSSADANRTVFDDAAATSITAGSPPFVGTFRPQGTLASYYYNGTPNGNWKLHIVDSFGGSLGTLRNWSLLLYPVGCSDGGGNCDYCTLAISDAITPGSHVQTNRCNIDSVVSSCGLPKAWNGVGSIGTNFHYNAYSYTNTSGADACVTVDLQSSSNLVASTYLNSFDPNNIANNFLGNAGYSTAMISGGNTSYSTEIPNGSTFVVVVCEGVTNSGTQSYTLQLSGLPCPAPTLAIVPAAPTNSVRVHWPTWAGSYKLETVPALNGSSWIAVTNEPIINLGRLNVTNAVLNTNRFYRLHKP